MNNFKTKLNKIICDTNERNFILESVHKSQSIKKSMKQVRIKIFS